MLTAAPTPSAAAKLSKARLKTLLKRSGRQRNLQSWADRLHAIFAAPQLRHRPIVEAAFGQQVQALLLQLDAACRATDQLLQAAKDAFMQHPDADILTQFPWARRHHRSSRPRRDRR